jgi:hypothetical protein
VKRNSLRGPGQYTINLNYTSPPLNLRAKKVDAATVPGGAAPTAAASNVSAQDALIQSALNAGLPLASIQQLIASISTQPGLILGPGGAPTTQQPTLTHPRITFSFNVANLLNNTRVNGYSGAITSPLFGKPTGYGPGRSIILSINSSF